MKNNRKAFTLIELLTVIAIIGILAGIIVPTVGAVRERANVAKTKSMFSQWVGAIELYRQEYGYYPNIGSGTDSRTINIASESTAFVSTMQGTNTTTNPRGVRFFSFSEDSFEQQPDNTFSDTQLADTFNNTNIRIVMDADRDGEITSGLPSGVSRVRTGVVVYSIPNTNNRWPEIRSWE